MSKLIWAVTGLFTAYVIWGSLHTPETLWAPGHLSRYHADVVDCTLCHQPFFGATNSKCIVCHGLGQFQLRSQPEVLRFHQDVMARAQSCLDCHTEHRGVLASITIGTLDNPHGEFIFRVTGTTSCSECHVLQAVEEQPRKPVLLDNPLVRHLVDQGEGAHRPGHFAQCLKCHRGGRLDVEEDED